jgi:hypothetical protein
MIVIGIPGLWWGDPDFQHLAICGVNNLILAGLMPPNVTQTWEERDTTVGSQDKQPCQVLVTHTCNPSYSRGRDQEDRGSKPAHANSLRDLISKNTHHTKGLVAWLKV